jgi:hypothetical protein
MTTTITLPETADTDPDLIRLRTLRECYAHAHNGFYLTRADYEADVVALSDETSAVKCVNHRRRAALVTLADQPLCGDCALPLLIGE